MFSWGFIALSTLGSVLGQLILKHAMVHIARTPNPNRSLLLNIMLSPRVIGGMIVYGFGVIFWLMAMSYLEVTVVYPFASMSYIGVILGSAFLFKETITTTRLLGIGIIITGVMIIGFSAGVSANP